MSRIGVDPCNTASARNIGSDHTQDDPTAEMLRFALDAGDSVAMQSGDAERLAAVVASAMPASARTPAALASYGPRSSDVAARVFAIANVLKGDPVTFDRFVVEPPPPRSRPMVAFRPLASGELPSLNPRGRCISFASAGFKRLLPALQIFADCGKRVIIEILGLKVFQLIIAGDFVVDLGGENISQNG